jgi:hypothetical protein
MFRRGVRLGALAGIAYGVSKVLQNRRSQPPVAAPWRPADAPAPAPRPAPVARPQPEAEPEPATEEVTVEVDEAAAEGASESLAGDAPPAPPAPTGEFDLPRVRPARPDSADTAKRAPARTAKRASKRASVASKSWVEASGSVCPPSHPVKAKQTSFLYHLPGMAAYERTKPDRCYRDERAARADGFLPAKR